MLLTYCDHDLSQAYRCPDAASIAARFCCATILLDGFRAPVRKSLLLFAARSRSTLPFPWNDRILTRTRRHRTGKASMKDPADPRTSRDGGVAEWSKAHAWKVCRRETVSRVRIPLPPPIHDCFGPPRGPQASHARIEGVLGRPPHLVRLAHWLRRPSHPPNRHLPAHLEAEPRHVPLPPSPRLCLSHFAST